MIPEHFSEGSVILEKNTIGDWMYIIRSGQVKVHNGDHTVAVLEAGEVIGELSLLKSEVRSMSVTAIQDTSTYSISHDDFFGIAEKSPSILSGILGVLVDRLRNQTTATLRNFELREQELTRLVEERTIDLRNKNLELERTQKYKEQFLANMSHEIRTPMTAILGLTNLVLETQLTDKQRNYLTSVYKASDNLLNIINEILDFSKIEAGKIDLEQMDFSVRDVIEQVCQTLKHKTDEKGTELISMIAPEVPEVIIGDPARLNQILINLAGNAIKFTEKGSVAIEVVRTPQGMIRFAVTDTGIGIPEDKLHHIFESFSQAFSSDSRKYGGTGLGLTISKQFVELMGGNMIVESLPGSGSTFSFELNLPLGSKERLAQQNAAERIDGSSLDGLRILLVDDNEVNRVVCYDTLTSKANVQITEATNGKEAVEKVRGGDFDVVLMDVQMPEMDGCEATRYIREHLPSPKNAVPIIALTASVIRKDLDKCRDSGMNDYIPKPFKPVQLFTTIAKNTVGALKPQPALHISAEVVAGTTEIFEAENKSIPPVSQNPDLGYLHDFCKGDRTKMLKYINLFLESAPSFIEKLKTALSENDYKEIASQMHGFKLKFVMMGMDRAKDLGMELEMDCREENPDSNVTNQKTTEVINLVLMSIVALEKYKGA